MRQREVNYIDAEIRTRTWNFDRYRAVLPAEQPGPPEPDGVWETACRLVRDYEFSPPALIRARYDPTEPLLGRNILLEGRFSALRLLFGVRITSVINESREPDQRAWGWGYETLEGHLERGKISFAVVKHQGSGAIEFLIDAYSQPAPTLGPLSRLGWAMFGRSRQLRFYRECGDRMLRFTRSGVRLAAAPRHDDGLVLAPSDARPHPFDWFAVRYLEPG